MCNEFRNIIAITNRSLCARPYLEQIKRVCSVHPAALVLREKDLPAEEYQELAGQVMKICAQYEVPCILHYYPEVAEELGNKNIHLPLWKLQGKHLLQWERLGCSIHSVEEAVEAERLGATYLTAGHIYATDCKKGMPPRGLNFLQEVCSHVQIPVYAIGGIELENRKQLSEVIMHGAAGACIMSGMMRL